MSKQQLSGRFISKRVPWTDDELIIVLAYYFFIYEYNTREQDYCSFADDLRKMTGNTRTNGSVGVRFGNYISVDPAKESIGFKGGDKKCKPIWNLCINKDRTPKTTFIIKFIEFINQYGDNKGIYKPFLNKYSKYLSLRNIEFDDEYDIITKNDINNISISVPTYEPETKPELLEVTIKKYKINSLKAKRAIIYSNFCCSLNKNHESFISKNGKRYMEAHYLIPMNAQDDFDVSLDVDANIVSLCPLCHKKLHYGADIDEELKILFENRKELLRQSGINISFDSLKKYYK